MKKTITTTEFTDDIDGGKAKGTVRFAYDGIEMEIDLSAKNRNAMEKVFKPYIDAARKVPTTRAKRPTIARRAPARRPDLAAIRNWANANGIAVSGRGRVAADVVAAYDAAK